MQNLKIILHNGKLQAYYILSIVIAILVIIYLANRIQAKNQLIDQKETVIAEKNALIEYRTTENGRILAEKQAAEIRAKDLEESYPEIYASLRRDMDINTKNLKAFIQNEFEARGTGQGSVTTNNYYDSSSGKTLRFKDFHMSDGYLTFDTRLYDSLSSALYTYVYIDTAKTAIHGKKKCFICNEKLYATTIFSNPQAKITGTTNILVNNYRDKRWVLSAGISTTYYDDKFRFLPAIHLGYAIFKF